MTFDTFCGIFSFDKTSGYQRLLFVFISIQMPGCYTRFLLKMSYVMETTECKVWAKTFNEKAVICASRAMVCLFCTRWLLSFFFSSWCQFLIFFSSQCWVLIYMFSVITHWWDRRLQRPGGAARKIGFSPAINLLLTIPRRWNWCGLL